MLFYLLGTDTVPAVVGLLFCFVGAAVYAVKTKKGLPQDEETVPADAEQNGSAGAAEHRRLNVKYALLLLTMLFLFVGYACAPSSLLRKRPESFFYVIATHDELPPLLVASIWCLLCDRMDKRFLLMRQ